MKWKARITVLLTALFGHKLAWATTTGVIAGVTASQLGRDPVPWLIGAAAVTVVYAYWRPEDKPKALANGVVSVFMAGVGAPLSGAYLVKWEWVDPAPINDWALAGILGACWPFFVPLGGRLLERWAGRKADGQ